MIESNTEFGVCAAVIRIESGHFSSHSNSMRNVKHILLPTDFSQKSLVARPAAVALAKRYGATLHVLHVVPPVTPPAMQTIESAGIRTIDEDFRAEGEGLLRELAQEIGSGVQVQTHVLSGTPADAIERCVSEHDIDLVALATHGNTGLDRVLLGSTAEKVIRTVPCSVLVCREKPESWDSIGTLLLPVAAGELEKVVVAEAVELARESNASLHLLHVLVPPPQQMRHVLRGHGLLNVQEQARKTMDMHLLAIEESEIQGAVPSKREVREGSPGATSALVAEEIDAGLVVVGTHARAGLARFVLGSAAERIARQAPCSVLVVKPG